MFHRQQEQISQKANKALEKQEQRSYTTAPQVKETHPATLIQRAKAEPSSLSADEVLSLQSAIGNREVSRLLAGRSGTKVQAKLTIGEPGDKYEQEADRLASQVVEQLHAPASAESAQGQSVQRQDIEDEELQAKPSISDLQRVPLSPEVQREAMPEEEDLQAKSILQRQEAIDGKDASTDLESAINRARGSGQPLDAGLQQSMGQAMGADFSGVKVHTDAQSDQLNQSIQARAFTTGQDIFFRQGEYNPGSRGGQELIAHELTHVVQQTDGIQTHLSREQPLVQRELNITSDLVQKTPIGDPPHNYVASNSNGTFISDHLAQSESDAQAATLNRANSGRGTTNTVLMETDLNVKNLVLAADYDEATHLYGSIWTVPINCRYRIIRAAHGDNGNILRETGDEITGTVWVKVFFDERARRFSITGVWGQQ